MTVEVLTNIVKPVYQKHIDGILQYKTRLKKVFFSPAYD